MIASSRLVCRCSLLAGVALTATAPLVASTPPAPTLASAAQVRALTEQEARRGLPVHLHGVFMGDADPAGIAFVVQDDTEGIYVQGPAEQVAGLRRGDLLEIEGVTDPGGFAPYVVAQQVRRIGDGVIPPPAVVTLDELNAGRMDAKWVEFTGIVRSVEPKIPTDVAPPPPGTRYAAPAEAPVGPGEPKVKIKLAAGGARLVVELRDGQNAAAFVDAEVRLRGLCFNLHNRNRQFVRPFVQVPRGVPVVIEKPPPAQPFSGEPRAVATLLQFEQLSGRHGHRVFVRGVVIHHQPGVALWIRDRDHSLRVESTQPEPLHPGDEVDVAGFPARGEYSAVLEDAVFRKRATVAAPAPQGLADLSDALRKDADLVQLEARLIEVRRFPDNVALILDWRGTPVRAQAHPPPGAPLPVDWLPGSIVRVSGVCSVLADGAGPLGGLWEPRSFQLLLRSTGDVAVVQPAPWWTAERAAWILSGFLLLAVGAVALVMQASRRRLKEKDHRRAMAEAEFTAILSERNRVAREIHDTLSQSLGAISVQLELVRTHATDLVPPAREHLGAAHQLARAALTEARESIWNMRAHVLEQGDLAEALEGILTRLCDGTGVSPAMHVEGDRRRLPPVVENNLLRIGQEAITNASKHAQPTRIEVTLVFEGRTVRLVVRDDGIGFVPGAPVAGQRRSFGLVGIRERAELLGGTAEITSRPGAGTRVVVTVSV
jgi:signal transduction histidine kinase